MLNSELQLKQFGCKLTIRKKEFLKPEASAVVTMPPHYVFPTQLLTSQISAPSTVGDEVQKGQVIWIIEAMKLMNEIEVMSKNLEPVVSMVLNSFQDPQPRVRWTAVNAVGQLSTDLGPDLQVKYHHLVLPVLAATMDDYQIPRI